MSSNATMMVTPHNLSEPETIGLSVPCGGGNFSLSVGMSFDEAPMKAAAMPAAPFAHVPICSVANHTFNAAGLRRSSMTTKPNATIKTPLAVNSMCAITIPRNHATAEGGMNPTTQPTVIWSTPKIRVQRLIFALKLSISVVIGLPVHAPNDSPQAVVVEAWNPCLSILPEEAITIGMKPVAFESPPEARAATLRVGCDYRLHHLPKGAPL